MSARRPAWLAGLVLLVLSAGAPAHAQREPRLSDAEVAQAVRLIVANAGHLLCDRGMCSPPTQAELRQPPVSLSDARLAISRGLLSAFADSCGLDWRRRNYLPLMAHWRRHGHSERQVAMLGALHGYGTGLVRRVVQGTSCSDQDRRNYDQQLTFRQ